jgi:hypothetical protein
VQLLWKAIWKSLKLKIELPYDPVIPVPAIYLKECAPEYDGATCTFMFIEALFAIAKLWKQPRCPMADEWIKKMWYKYIMELLFSHKEE